MAAYEPSGSGSSAPLPAAARTDGSSSPTIRRPRDAMLYPGRVSIGWLSSGSGSKRSCALLDYLPAGLSLACPWVMRAGGSSRPAAMACSLPCAVHCLGAAARSGRRRSWSQDRRARTPVLVNTLLKCPARCARRSPGDQRSRGSSNPATRVWSIAAPVRSGRRPTSRSDPAWWAGSTMTATR